MSTVQENTITKDLSLRTKHDPLIGYFSWLRKFFPIINSHVCIVESEINPAILNLALRGTLDRFEQFRDLLAADDETRRRLLSEDAVAIASFEHPITLDTYEFREALMALIAMNEKMDVGYWPVRLHLVQAADRRRSCLHLGMSHDMADAKSGNIFLVELMREYMRLEQEDTPGIGTDGERKLLFKHLPLKRLKPNWFTTKSQIVRWVGKGKPGDRLAHGHQDKDASRLPGILR